MDIAPGSEPGRGETISDLCNLVYCRPDRTRRTMRLTVAAGGDDVKVSLAKPAHGLARLRHPLECRNSQPGHPASEENETE
jgi:hypothetical protein